MRKRWALASIVGISVALGGLIAAKRLTHLPVLILVGWASLLACAFMLALAFLLPPLAEEKALRNAFVVRSLPLPLYAIGAFLGASGRIVLSLCVVLLAILLHHAVVRPYAKRLRTQSRKQSGVKAESEVPRQ